MASFMDSFKRPGETDVERKSRVAREAAAKPAEDKRKKAEDEAAAKRKRPAGGGEYGDKLGAFFNLFGKK